MTKEEKLAILEAAEERAYRVLAEMQGGDLASEAVGHLFHCIESVEWALHRITQPEPAEADLIPQPDIAKEEVTPVKESVKLDPIEEPKPEPETPTITKQQMVTKLTAFQSNGVAIDEVMQSMGYAKLSQVPAERYWELLEKCQKEADGEG